MIEQVQSVSRIIPLVCISRRIRKIPAHIIDKARGDGAIRHGAEDIGKP
jgi:hypothetical protein